MVVKIAGHKNAQRRRQGTTRMSIPIDMCNELSCGCPDLTGYLFKPKIKRLFKAQGCSSAVNSYFSRLYPFACRLSHFDSKPSCPLLHCTRRPSRAFDGHGNTVGHRPGFVVSDAVPQEALDAIKDAHAEYLDYIQNAWRGSNKN
jgi:hypothetical protein